MQHHRSSSFKTISLLLALSLLPFQAGLALAETSISPVSGDPLVIPQPQTSGRLETRGNQPIQVNGVSATSGATILSGTTLETGAGIGATINLGALGSVDLAPNTKVVLEFSNGQIKVTLTQGCLILRYKSGVYAEIDNAQGKLAASDPNPTTAGALDVCQQPNAPTAIVNQGAAANAGAGAGTGGGAAAAAGGGLSAATVVLILGAAGAAVAIPVILSGGNDTTTTTP